MNKQAMMKKMMKGGAVHTLLAVMLALAPACAALAQRQLVVLHTNDTHSCVMPLGGNLADTMLAGRGGFVRRVALVDDEREKNPDLLLFDSGDFSQGSPYYTLFKGDVEVGLMNLMKYDAATIGNHEFDFGMDNMARIFRKAEFPIVCANYDFTGTPLEGLVKPWVVIRRHGLKIGVFGLGPKLDGLVSAVNYGSIRYEDPIAKAQQVASMLKREKKCDVVICLSHLGWNVFGTDDTELIPATRDIDLVLGGHSHTYFRRLEWLDNRDGHPVADDQNGKHGAFVGRLVLEFKK